MKCSVSIKMLYIDRVTHQYMQNVHHITSAAFLSATCSSCCMRRRTSHMLTPNITTATISIKPLTQLSAPSERDCTTNPPIPPPSAKPRKSAELFNDNTIGDPPAADINRCCCGGISIMPNTPHSTITIATDQNVLFTMGSGNTKSSIVIAVKPTVTTRAGPQ